MSNSDLLPKFRQEHALADYWWRRLTESERRVAFILIRHINPNTCEWAMTNTIYAEKTNMSERTVIRAFNSLESRGCVETVYGRGGVTAEGSGRASTRRARFHESMTPGCHSSTDQRVTEQASKGDKNLSKGCHPDVILHNKEGEHREHKQQEIVGSISDRKARTWETVRTIGIKNIAAAEMTESSMWPVHVAMLAVKAIQEWPKNPIGYLCNHWTDVPFKSPVDPGAIGHLINNGCVTAVCGVPAAPPVRYNSGGLFLNGDKIPTIPAAECTADRIIIDPKQLALLLKDRGKA